MIEKVLVLPDIHTPKHEESCIRSVLQFAKDYKPHKIILLGDLVNMDSLSRHPLRRHEHLISFQEEVAAGELMLDRIENVLSPRTRKVFCEGNHEERFTRFDLTGLTEKEKKLLGRSSIGTAEEELNLKSRRWKFVRFGDVYQHDKALFSHGFYVNQYHASKTVRRWFETIVYGHTHQWQVHSVVGRDRNPVAAMSIGTLSQFDLGYNTPNPDWVHMFAYFDFYGHNRFTAHTIPLINGTFTHGGKVYGQ